MSQGKEEESERGTYGEGIGSIRYEKTRLFEPLISGWVWGNGANVNALPFPQHHRQQRHLLSLISLGHKSGRMGEKHTFYCLHYRGTSEGKVDESVGVEVTLNEVWEG
jgi:hypothetical protein